MLPRFDCVILLVIYFLMVELDVVMKSRWQSIQTAIYA